MTKKKQIILFWMPEYLGSHSMTWRRDELPRNHEMDFGLVLRQFEIAERGRLHGALLADTLAVGYYATEMSIEGLSRTAKGSRWEPLTLLSAVASRTRHIGLLGSVNALYSEPYNVARMLASLDHVSRGRAGWNVDTTPHPLVDRNFGKEEHAEQAVRQERAAEFVEVVAGLWDSWEDDAFVRDKASGRYFDPLKLHALNYRGDHLTVAGPLNIARPIQGHPVIVQTGHAAPDFGSRNADVICTWSPDIESGRQLYGSLKSKAAKYGRNPDHIKVLPALILSVGRSRAHAQEKIARLDELVDPRFGLELLRCAIGADLSSHPLNGPVPDVAEDQSGARAAQHYYLDVARRQSLSIRQLMQVIARVSVIPGSATEIADMMQGWVEADAADGFTITFDNDSDSLEIFVDLVVPELQRRGLFQREYRGTTLRENLGLPRPANRFSQFG